jgi:phage-related minor tail protein
MAGYIKGITIEFGADVSKLNAGLKKAQGTINKTQAELRQINQALKFNPRNTTLLKQKFDLLKLSVSQTEDKLKQLRAMQAQMDAAGVDKASAQYRQLEREIVKTESQLKQAEAELRAFGSVGKQQALAVGNAFKTAGSKIKSAGRTITTTVSVWGMAGIYAGSKLIEMSEKQAQAEQKLTEIYKSRMGVGTKAVQSTLKLAAAEQKAGVVGDEVQIAAAQQLATYAKYPSTVNAMLPALNDLLVQQKGLNGTQEDAVGLANLFGKAMMGQTGALKRAGISFTEAQEEVLKYGTEEEKAAMIAEVVQQNVGNMNEEFAKTDAGKIQQAKNELGDMGEQIGAVLLPAVAQLVSWFQAHLMPVIQRFIDFMQQHPQIATFALALAGITAAIGPLLMVAGSLVSAIGGIISIVAVAGPAIAALAAPVGIAVAAIAAAIVIGVKLYKNWDTIKAKATAFANAVKTTFNNFKTSVATTFNNIKTAITKPLGDAKEKVSDIVEKIKGFFPLKLGKIVSFLLPNISVSSIAKKIGEKLTHAPKFSVGSWTRYAKAMNTPYLFTRPTGILAGEAGDEMIYGRKNLMRDIAQASGGGALNGVVVNVYGSDNMSVNDLAYAVEQRLITMQKRRTQAWA